MENEEAEAEPLSSGQVLRMLPFPSALADRLIANDNVRAESLFLLSVPHIPDLAPALSALLDDSLALAEVARQIDETPLLECAERVSNDISDAIEGMLNLREAVVMDACRDLMELTVLFRDFRLEPQRFIKWQRSAESTRRNDFGHNKLLFKHPEEEIPFTNPDREAVSIEYTVHSRTLHPAMYTHDRGELSRNSATEGDVLLRLGAFGSEICRHGSAALAALFWWLVSTHEGHTALDVDDLDLMAEDSSVNAFMTHWSAFLADAIPNRDDSMREWEARYRKPKKTDGEK